jgi:serine/threonine protein kinase
MATLHTLDAASNRVLSVPLEADEIVLGRASDCHVVLRHPGASRKHAMIRRIAGRYFIEDLNSRNGTFVNNQRLSKCVPLRHGNHIRICDSRWSFVDLLEDPDSETQVVNFFMPRRSTSSRQSPPDPLALPEGLRALLSSSELVRAVRIPLDWQPGDRIEHRWEVQTVLGGGMGIVYVVLDHETGDRLAAKTYRDDVLAAQPDLPARFEREALAWINLGSHPNVVKAKYFKRVRGKPLLFLEFVAGADLGRVLPYLCFPGAKVDTACYRLRTILELATQFCDGMLHIAKSGITAHRDIKPGNCLITMEGGLVLKITDFGLATAFDSVASKPDAPHIVRVPPDGSHLVKVASPETVPYVRRPEDLAIFVTRTGVAAGTPTHMAPEQFDDAKRVDARADIYAFGVMLFQMVMGRLPFTGHTWLDYRRAHQTMRPPELDGASPRFSSQWALSKLNGIVASCLSKDPVFRYPNFMALREALFKAASFYEIHEDDEYVTPTDFPEPVKPAAANPLTADEFLHQAQSLVELGRYEQALEIFNHLIEQNPKNGGAYLGKGLLLMNIFHRFDEALRSLEEAQRLGEHGLEEHIALCRKQLP